MQKLLGMQFNMNKLISIILISSTLAYSQGNYTPGNNNVYHFLERLSAKGLIDYSGIQKSLTRFQVTEHLNDLISKKNKLSNIERGELDWFLH